MNLAPFSSFFFLPFNRLKQFRRLAMRYEKLASMVLRVLRIVQSL